MRADTAGGVVHPLQSYLARLHGRHSGCGEGAVAGYIPELTKADPAWFGIAVATVDGHVYEVGDTRQAFTIQSISKPFTYALALSDQGRDAVLSKIGVEPSGDAFNSISLYQDSGRPFNPMINAGAIASTGLVQPTREGDRIGRILDLCSQCAGRPLAIDQAVFRSERDTGFRNFAIGYMLRNFGILESAPEPVLDAYFQQCSILVTARDLAIMAATLANGGVCPVTGVQAVDAMHVPQVLSVMATCGMYDYAGEWVYRIGMPSKSGVGGGIIGVLPGQMAVSVFSPPLDARGNSVRGLRVFEDLSNDFGLHMFRSDGIGQQVVRRRYTASVVGSKRLRPADDTRLLADAGRRVKVYELQGPLTVFTSERVIRELLSLDPSVEYLIVDFKRVSTLDRPALRLWREFLATIRSRFREVVLTELEHDAALAQGLGTAPCEGEWAFHRSMGETDAALEFCEDALLAGARSASNGRGQIRLEHFEACAGLDPPQLRALEDVLETETYAAGDTIVRRGDPSTAVYFLAKGRVSIFADLPNGGSRRLTTCVPGMLFGDMAVIERQPRSATVRADEAVECYSLSLESFDRLTATHPDLKVALLENFARALSRRVRRLTNEVRTLSG
jgi:glutaminase